MDRKRRIIISAVAAASALIAGSIAYLLLEAPDEFAVRLEIQERVVQRIRAETASIEGLSYQFIANEDLNDALHAYGKRPNRYDVALANLSFTRHLESQRIVASLLDEAFFLDFDEIDRIPLTMTEDFLRPEIAAVRRFAWARAVEADGVCVWMDDVFAVHGERYIIAARLIKRLRTGEPIGVLILLSNSRRAAEPIGAAGGEDSEVELSLVVSASGNILAASDGALIGESAAAALGSAADFWNVPAPKSESGRFWAERSGRRAAAIFTRIGVDSPYLVSVYRNDRGFAPVRRLLAAALFAAGAALAVAFGARGSRWERSEPPSARRFSGDDDGLPPGLPPLTSRERQLLALLSRGLSNKEIAGEFGIKEQTVKNYLRPLYDKLGVHDRVSALLKLRERRST